MPIVSAVGVAVGTHASGDQAKANRINEAMVEAIKEAQAAGITDQDEIRRRMMAARQKIMDAS